MEVVMRALNINHNMYTFELPIITSDILRNLCYLTRGVLVNISEVQHVHLTLLLPQNAYKGCSLSFREAGLPGLNVP